MRHDSITDREVFSGIRAGKIRWAGNARLKIYGTLDCWSGKRMHRKNRVFFSTEIDAQAAGYRPCKHCMRHKY
ncbi:MAG: Ada metal-binding domain-containing protein [Bacteroidota bacterium]